MYHTSGAEVTITSEFGTFVMFWGWLKLNVLPPSSIPRNREISTWELLYIRYAVSRSIVIMGEWDIVIFCISNLRSWSDYSAWIHNFHFESDRSWISFLHTISPEIQKYRYENYCNSTMLSVYCEPEWNWINTSLPIPQKTWMALTFYWRL